MNERISAEVELAWEDFHRLVNMTSDELRTWLLTDASGEVAFPSRGPDPGSTRSAPASWTSCASGRST